VIIADQWDRSHDDADEWERSRDHRQLATRSRIRDHSIELSIIHLVGLWLCYRGLHTVGTICYLRLNPNSNP